MSIVIHSALAEVNCERWNALLSDDYPFLKYEFLLGLEQTGCTTASTGWTPQHLALYAHDQGSILAVMPCYAKTHSYGEYIFDWAWADAYYRHGQNYYPKLSSAVPFTPATGARILTADPARTEEYTEQLLERALLLCEQEQYSGWHALFVSEQEANYFAKHPRTLLRYSNQFHWHNQNYKTFDEFLGSLNAKKRKNIKRERRRIQEQNVRYTWLTGDDLTHEIMHLMYGFYARTIQMYGAHAYLNLDFFVYLADHFARNTMVLLAHVGEQTIAGGLYFKSDHTLYGRYWGALNSFHSVHFETCYYQAIEWCIKNNYRYFEAGAQGEHKHARGLSPTRTYSAHWLRDPQFHAAIGEFISQEQRHVDAYQHEIAQHSPYRNEL